MHLDLFTGIGGFTLACHWAGIQTVVMCENDKRCRQFLERTWPGIPVINDVREFDGTRWRGQFLLTAGVPCQPASRAGKQGGEKDDRWLWGEALRVVSEARPDWCLFENPVGIDDVGLGGILVELEARGYEVAPPLIIPACAVNSPQLRARYWIVAHTTQKHGKESVDLRGKKGPYFGIAGSSQGDMADNTKQDDRKSDSREMQRQVQQFGISNGKGNLADTETTTGLGLQDGKEFESPTQNGRCNADFWGDHVWLPCADGKVRRAPDDTFGVVNGLHRSVLSGLGNSIVPQVAYEIIRAIINTDEKPR